jgi:Domain of unknown function (DUF4397)
MKRTSLYFLNGVAALGLVGAAGCIDTLDDDYYVSNPPDTLASSVRVINVAETGAVDVWLNGSGPAFSDLSPSDGSPFLELVAGGYTVDFTSAGAKSSQPASMSIPSFFAAPGAHFTAVAFGSSEALAAITIEEDFSGVPGGFIRLRPVNVAPGVELLDIWDVTDASAPFLLADGVFYGQAGASFEVAAGPLQIGFDIDGDADPDQVFDVSQLQEGDIANLFATMSAAGDLGLVTQRASGETTTVQPGVAQPGVMVRAIHLSPDSPDFDLYSSDTSVGSDLVYQASTLYQSIEAGMHTFSLVESGFAPSTSIYDFEPVDLVSGSHYTAVAFGAFDGLEGLVVVDDAADIGAGQFRLRAVHASPALGQFDVIDASDPDNLITIDQNISYGRAGSPLDMASDVPFVLGLDLNDDQTPDVSFQIEGFVAGSYVNLFAVNDGPQVFLAAQQADGEVMRYDTLLGQ